MIDPKRACWPSKTEGRPALSICCPPIFGAAMRTRVNETPNQENVRQKKKAPETMSRKPFS